MSRCDFIRASAWAAMLSAACCASVQAGEQPAAGTTEVLQEVVITGSRLQTGGFNAPTPVTVVTAETIEQRAPANIADVINEQPAFRIDQTDTTRNAGGLPQQGQQVLNLRALGGNRTLVLINGHRAVATNWSGTVDTNIVPVGLVERIETVTGGASAAYGSDAVAGVTNIILRNKMNGLTGNLQTGVTEYAAGKQYTGAFAGGRGFLNNRLNVIGGIDYNKSDSIRDVYGAKWAQSEIGNYQPTTAQRAALGLPATVISTGVEPATTAPGGLLYAGTVGGLAWTFDGNGNPVPFTRGTIGNAANIMVGSNSNYGYNTGNERWLRNPNSRIDTYARVGFDVNDRITAYIEGNKSHNSIGPFKQNNPAVGDGQGGTNAALTIARTNSFVTPAILALLSPGTGNFTIGRINTDFGGWGNYGGSFVQQVVDSHRLVTGLDGRFGQTWKWDLYAQFGRSRLELRRNDYIYSALQKAVNGCVSTLGSPGFPTTTAGQTLVRDVATYESLTGKTCTPFNPFGSGRNSLAAIDYINNATKQLEHIDQDVYAASLSGSPFAVPAGAVAIAVGAEYRREHIIADSDNVSQLGTIANANLVEFTGGFNVKEMFAEVGVPLAKDMKFARSIDLNVAGRRTDYELSGTVTTWKGGLTWDPTGNLRVRYTRSRDIRAPTVFEVFLVGGNTNGNVANHIASGVVGRNGTVNVNPNADIPNATSQSVLVPGSGGGPTLRPEIADTSTGGLVWQRGGFQVSGDFYNIRIKDAIAMVGAQQTVDFCRDGDLKYCQAIVFDATSPGGISLVDSRMYNLNSTKLNGYDFEVGYRHAMLGGRASVRGLINYQPSSTQYNAITRQTQENANTLGNQPKVGYNLSLGYERDRMNATVQFRGFLKRRGNSITYNPDGTVATTTTLGPEDEGYNPANANTTNVNRWPGQFTVNPSFSYRITDKINASFNIDNLFNVGPPPLSTNNVYDLIGRRYRAGVRASF